MFVSIQMQKMPKPLQNGFQMTPKDFNGFNLWHWMFVQDVSKQTTQNI